MGAKSSKNHLANVQPLNKETVKELCEDTGFTEEELVGWHTNFYNDCPDGRLTLKQFEQEYAKIMGKPTQKTADYVRHMFSVYDQDKNQFIDFKEFVMALSAASVVNRLRLIETLFHVFDLDNDGKITKEEIGKMLHTLVDVTDSNNKQARQRHRQTNQQIQNKQKNLQTRIDDAFNELNANDDDHITKDEFIEWYTKSGLITDVQTNEIAVTDPSRIQQIEKKSRKLMKQTSHEPDDNRHRVSQLVRHMSRMTERKSPAIYEDEDEDSHSNNNNNPTTVSATRYPNNSMTDNERTITNPAIRVITSSDDSDSHYSKENDRWQHLFNSVLGQIRTQRVKEPPQPNGENDFHSWKRDSEDKLKSEYLKQKTNGEQKHSYFSTTNNVLQPPTIISDQRPPSPDIITIRL